MLQELLQTQAKMFKQCCRTCLEQTIFSELRSLFDTYKDFVIRDALWEMFQIEVHQTDVLSTICTTCLAKLCTAHEIRHQFMMKDRFYRQMAGTKATNIPKKTQALSNCAEASENIRESMPAVESTTQEDSRSEFNIERLSGDEQTEESPPVEKHLEEFVQDSVSYVLERTEPVDYLESCLSDFELKLVSVSPASKSNARYEIVAFEATSESEDGGKYDSSIAKPVPEDDESTKFEDILEISDNCLASSNPTCKLTISDVGDESAADQSSDIFVQFYCTNCKKMFKTHEELVRHVATCDSCQGLELDSEKYIQVDPSTAQSHNTKMKTSRKRRPESFECTKCAKTFRTRFKLEHHRKKMHLTVKRKAVKPSVVPAQEAELDMIIENHLPCEFCCDAFAEECDLLQHLKQLHGEECKVYRCETCDEEFAYLGSLAAHQKLIHSKRFLCRYCHKAHETATALEGHENMHTKEKSFVCSICNRAFPQYTSMRRHMKIHSDVKSHACDVCGKQFRQRTVMLGHRRRHTGEKPYKCNQCIKSFRDHSTLAKHRRVHLPKALAEDSTR